VELKVANHYQSLLRSDFPVTWTAVLQAWKGFPDVATPVSNLLSTTEVLKYANHRIGLGPMEQEQLVTRLAFTDETDPWKIHLCLQQLASRGAADIHFGLRVWRWILLDEIVAEWERLAEAGPPKDIPPNWQWEDDFATAVYCDARDFWSQFECLSEACAVAETWRRPQELSKGGDTMQIIEEYRNWLTQEAVVVRQLNPNEETGQTRG
jgi:hypothetical protein